MPIFGFANAGVTLGAVDTLFEPLPLGIAAGLFVGKQIGVLGAVWCATRFGWVSRPRGASWPQICGTALLCGIGFTMSLFIGGLAFAEPAEADAVKIGVLAGSMLSAMAGYIALRFATGPE